MKDIRPKIISNWNLANNIRFRCRIILKFFFFLGGGGGTAVSLPYFLQNFKTIGHLQNKLWTNENSRELSLRCVSDENTILHKAPGMHLK